MKSEKGIGVVGTITIVFVILRIINLISWSWWWVFSPLWIAVLISLVIVGFSALFDK